MEKRMGDTTDLKPRIYVACLAAYNSGIRHGAWIDADQTEEADILDEIHAMLKASPVPDAEEYAIHDYEGFGDLDVGEYMGIDEVRRLAAFVGEHGSLGVDVARHFGGDIAEARDALEDRYVGCFDSLDDYMEMVTEESVTIPEALRYYIDWKAMGRDALMSGEIFAIETAHREVHVFHTA
jgi:antirestriction protein